MGNKPKLYYNSACPVCRTGIEQQRATMNQKLPDGSDTIAWCDIATAPEAAQEIDRTVDQIRHSLHMVDSDGRLLVGADVAVAIWAMTPGRRWLGWLVGLPGIRQLARWGYDRVADRLTPGTSGMGAGSGHCMAGSVDIKTHMLLY